VAALAAPGRALAPPERPLMDRMRSAGLERVERLAGEVVMVGGELSGTGGLRVLLFAGCGPGAAASRDAALLAAADLARTPRRHTLELVLCATGGAGPDAARLAAAAWLEAHPAAAVRDAVLAALHLELGDGPGAAVTGLPLAAGRGAKHRLPPAWLFHAAVRGARTAGAALAIGDPSWPLLGQLLGRYGRARALTGAEPFLLAGVPALTLAGGGATGWPAVLASIVRRLDALAGRPRDDDACLAVAGRVLSRRDLYWLGLAVWLALLAAGRPGAWRGAASGQRRRRGRLYLPRFLLRMGFLAALLLAPAATLVLLAPPALASLVPLGRPAAVRALRLLAAAPALCFAGIWALALAAGRVTAWPAEPLRLALVLGGVILAVGLVGGMRPGRAAG
jgi:hypothetical protein